MFILCVDLSVSPATSVTAERSFSMDRRVKTWLRSSIIQQIFNTLAILNTHKNLTEELDLAKVENKFFVGSMVK